MKNKNRPSGKVGPANSLENAPLGLASMFFPKHKKALFSKGGIFFPFTGVRRARRTGLILRCGAVLRECTVAVR